MVYPPPAQKTDATDALPAPTEHPGRHNGNGAAINDIVAELGQNPSGTHATVEARLDAQARLLVPNRVGRWHSSPAVELAISTALTLDRVYWMPYPVFDPIRVDAIGAWSNSAVVGAVYTLALYGSTAAGEPGARLEMSLGLDAATTGNKIHAFPAARTLARGLYWVAMVNTGAANNTIGYAAASNEWVSGTDVLGVGCYIAGGGTASLTDPAPANLLTQAMFINVMLRAAA